jgi:hypothetical protein
VSVVLGAESDTLATGAGAAGVTVSDADPVFSSAVAMMVVDPAATAVTRPVADTVAKA